MAGQVKSIATQSPFNIWFAKFQMGLGSEKRLRIYRKITSLLRNNFSLGDALERIWIIESKNGKKPDEPTAIAISDWLFQLQKGKNFGDALAGWVPERERMMLMVGDMSRIDDALENLVMVSEGYKRILQPLTSALGYPAFLIVLTIVLLIMIGLYMVPPMTEFFQGKHVGGVAGSLIGLSNWMKAYWYYLPPAIIAVFILITCSMKWLTGPIRRKIDKIPPWSLFRMFTGVSMLLSLAALVKSGVPIVKAVQLIRRDANKYLAERLDMTLVYMRNGENFGSALEHTGYEFPTAEIVGDLAIYSELDDFETALDKLAQEFLEDSITTIKQAASMLNGIAMMLISLVISWVLFGIFDISNQISNTF